MKLPGYFEKIFWSYDLSSLDTEKDRRMVIINTVNYGELKHWRWVLDHYGKDQVKEILAETPTHQIRERVKPLASIVFDVEGFNDAPRGLN